MGAKLDILTVIPHIFTIGQSWTWQTSMTLIDNRCNPHDMISSPAFGFTTGQGNKAVKV
jgi:hypothetical protein